MPGTATMTSASAPLRTWLGWNSLSRLAVELVVYAAVAVAFVDRYLVAIAAFDAEGVRFRTHEEVATGTALEPYRFRVLLPVVVRSLQALHLVPDRADALDDTYALVFGTCFVVVFLATRVMLTTYGWRPATSLVGPLLLMAVLPVAFGYHDFQPWSWFEAASVPVVVTLLLGRRHLAWVLLVVGLATLNRETALTLSLVPVALMLAEPRGRRWDRYLTAAALGSLTVWAMVEAVLQWWIPGPGTGRVIGLAQIWETNIHPGNAPVTIFTVGVFVLPIGVAAMVGAVSGRAPRAALMIAVLTIPIYVLSYLAFALWVEVRVLVPGAILALPLALAVFTAPDGTRSVSTGSSMTRDPSPPA